jgi:hypothetical protein
MALIMIIVLWGMTPCSFVYMCQRFEGTCTAVFWVEEIQEQGGSNIFPNIGTYLSRLHGVTSKKGSPGLSSP